MWIKCMVIYCIILAVYGQTIVDSKKLIRTLLEGYDNLVRPVADQSQPVNLTISLDLFAIQELNEVIEKFSVAAVIYIRWQDPSMTWSSSAFNGLDTIMIPKPKVWTPTIIVKNSFDTVKPIGEDSVKVRYHKNGDAFYMIGNIFKTTCSIDVTFYPYDTQTCNITLISWPANANEVIISASEDYIKNSYFSENGEWEVTSTSVITRTIDVLSTIDFTIKLKRRSRFILVNFLLPVFFIGILNIMVFILPAESGERVSFCITVLLAFVVFLTIAGSNLPKISQPMPMICNFLIANLSLSTFICIMTILNLRLFHKPESEPVPRFLAAIAQKFNCMCTSINEIPVTREKMSSKLETKSNEVCGADEKFVAAVTWKKFSEMVDTVLFIFSSILLIMSFITYIATMQANQ